MIEVPIDKIISVDDAVGNINNIIESTHAEKGIYVLTKNGKPYAAVIDIDYLEHLPEMRDKGETKKIHEIGQEETKIEPEENTDAKPQEPQIEEIPPAPVTETVEPEPVAPPVQEIQEKTQTPEMPKAAPPTKPTTENSDEVYGEDIGPWQKPQDEQKNDQSEKDSNEPPDLPI